MTGPCGNGFDTAALAGQYKRIAVVGGGIGTAPLLLLCKELCRAGVRPDLFVGFRDTTYGMDRFVPVSYTHLDVYKRQGTGGYGIRPYDYQHRAGVQTVFYRRVHPSCQARASRTVR